MTQEERVQREARRAAVLAAQTEYSETKARRGAFPLTEEVAWSRRLLDVQFGPEAVEAYDVAWAMARLHGDVVTVEQELAMWRQVARACEAKG